jgi:hypothetical protein
VLYDAAEALRVAAVLLLPVMPTASAEILRRAGERTPAGALRLEVDGAWKPAMARDLVKAPALWPRLEARAEPGAGASAGSTKETAVSNAPEWKPSETTPATEAKAGDVAPPAAADARRPRPPRPPPRQPRTKAQTRACR